MLIACKPLPQLQNFWFQLFFECFIYVPCTIELDRLTIKNCTKYIIELWCNICHKPCRPYISSNVFNFLTEQFQGSEIFLVWQAQGYWEPLTKLKVDVNLKSYPEKQKEELLRTLQQRYIFRSLCLQILKALRQDSNFG